MKKIIIVAIFLCSAPSSIISCPTCLGKLEKDTPALFSKKYDDLFWPQSTKEQKNTQQNSEKKDTKKVSFKRRRR